MRAWIITLCSLGAALAATGIGLLKDSLTELDEVYNGPVTFDFVTSSTVVISERTCLSLVELESGKKTQLAGSSTMGGYVDGEKDQARFRLINDVVVQGNYIYIADFSCIRIYDIAQQRVATLAGICGRMEEGVPSIVTTISPEFKGHLKLAVSARDLYVLDGDKVSRVDRETGVVWTLSVGRYLSEGHPTSIDLDRYSNTLFVAVAKPSEIAIIAIDIASGKQTIHQTITSFNKAHRDVTAVVASLDVAQDGTIYVLDPHGFHTINRHFAGVKTEELVDYGYHEIAVSSQYLVISQEFYSRMYKLHLMKLAKNSHQPSNNNNTDWSAQASVANEADIPQPTSLKIFESQTFYLAIVFPSVLFLLVILIVACAARKIIRSRAEQRYPRPPSDSSSEKYFLNQEGNPNETGYWM